MTDAPLLAPTLLSWSTGATIAPLEGVEGYVDATAAFVYFLQTGRRRGLLDEEASHRACDVEGFDGAGAGHGPASEAASEAGSVSRGNSEDGGRRASRKEKKEKRRKLVGFGGRWQVHVAPARGREGRVGHGDGVSVDEPAAR